MDRWFVEKEGKFQKLIMMGRRRRRRGGSGGEFCEDMHTKIGVGQLVQIKEDASIDLVVELQEGSHPPGMVVTRTSTASERFSHRSSYLDAGGMPTEKHGCQVKIRR